MDFNFEVTSGISMFHTTRYLCSSCELKKNKKNPLPPGGLEFYFHVKETAAKTNPEKHISTFEQGLKTA